MFFSYYTLAYIGNWLIRTNMISDLFYLFIPFVIALLADFVKRSRDLFKNDGTCCCCLCKIYFQNLFDAFFLVIIAPAPAIFLAVLSEFGISLGNLLTCFYMLPQVVMKYKERHERYYHLTPFEIGNFTCLSLWVVVLLNYLENHLNFYSFTWIFIQIMCFYLLLNQFSSLSGWQQCWFKYLSHEVNSHFKQNE